MAATDATTASARIELSQPLRQEQVRQFVEQGYLIAPDLMAGEELEELKADTAAIARGAYPCENLKPLAPSVSDEQALQSILCIHQPHFVSPVMLKYVKHPAVCGILSQITAAHLPYWDGSVKCMQSMLFVKPPGFQGQAWHQDEIYIPTRDRSLVGAWIALDDATVSNGCLYVIPASHRPGYLYPQHDHGRPEEFDFAQESFGFNESLQVPVEVKAGAVVFFNGYLLHRSFRNRSEVYRRVLVSHYMNAWSLLPWQAQDAQRQQPAARADDRCVVSVAGVDPYGWKGYEKPTQNVWLRTCKANQQAVEPCADHLKKKTS